MSTLALNEVVVTLCFGFFLGGAFIWAGFSLAIKLAEMLLETASSILIGGMFLVITLMLGVGVLLELHK